MHQWEILRVKVLDNQKGEQTFLDMYILSMFVSIAAGIAGTPFILSCTSGKFYSAETEVNILPFFNITQ